MLKTFITKIIAWLWAHQIIICRILSDMRTLSADWMANSSKPDSEMQGFQNGGEESRGTFFYPRPVAPTAAQVCAVICHYISLDDEYSTAYLSTGLIETLCDKSMSKVF